MAMDSTDDNRHRTKKDTQHSQHKMPKISELPPYKIYKSAEYRRLNYANTKGTS